MDLVKINLFGNFNIFVNDESINESFSRATKSIDVLKYLILNVEKRVDTKELLDLFWDGYYGKDPYNALKTLISRLRTNLEEVSPLFKGCILSLDKGYYFNIKKEFLIDIFEFENLYKEIMDRTSFDITNNFGKDIDGTFMKAIRIYKGPIFSTSYKNKLGGKFNTKYETMYVEIVNRYISYLKNVDNYEQLLYVAKAVLDINFLFENIQEEIIKAFFKLNRRTEAMSFYNYLITEYKSNFKMALPKRLEKIYYKLLEEQLENNVKLESVFKELKSISVDTKPLLCDYSIFQKIYQLQLRNIERWDIKMNLMLISVLGKNKAELTDLIDVYGTMDSLESVLLNTLRKGDTVTRYNFSQFLILLPSGNNFDGMAIKHRILKGFKEKVPTPTEKVNLVFEITSIDS